MKFKHMVIKNLKGSSARYLSYVLCNSFIISTFFMYSTLIFNDRLKNFSTLEEGVLSALVVPTVALLVFALIFISYAHSTFINARKKEFGVFMTLGMSINDLRKLILIENGLIAGISIIIGITTGLVFSRLFFLIVLKVLAVGDIAYKIGIINFSFSIGIFITIYLVNILVTIVSTYRFEITRLLKADRENKVNKISNPIIAVIGIGIIIFACIFLYKDFNKSPDQTSSLLFETTVLILVGLYITISQLGSLLIRICRKNSKIYNKRIIWLTGIRSKFKQSKNIIFMTSVLVMVVIFYLGMMLGMNIKAEKQELYNNPYDFSFCEYKDNYKFAKDEVKSIVEKYKQEITFHGELEFIYSSYNEEGLKGNMKEVFIKDMELNELGVENFKVNKGNKVELGYSNNASNQLKKIKSLINCKIMVLSEEDYIFKKKQIGYEEGKCQLYNVSNWKESKGIVDELGIPRKDSKIENYNYNKQGSSLLLFTVSYLSIFFFFATLIILFLKLLSDIERDKEKYRSIYRIGATTKELKSQIGKELKVMFFTGPVIGFIIGVFYTLTFAQDGAGEFKMTYVVACTSVGLVFFILLIIYYVLCKKRYCKEVLNL